MKNYFEILTVSPLFSNINETELTSLLACLSAKVAVYRKNDVIFSAEEKITSIGFVLSGSVHVVQDDFWGNRTILACIEPGSTFAEAFTCAEVARLPVSVIAVESCEIMLINYAKIMKTCPSSCTFHHTLIQNMLYILASKNVMLTKKMEHITRRKLREKLFSFLSEQATLQKSAKFIIPFDRQGLADYLAVDRSALSGELSRMQKEGLLTFHKNEFELKEPSESVARQA